MKTHLLALAVAVTVTGLAALAVDVGMREGAAERARLANSEPERVVITASREDQKLAARAAFTF